MEEERTTEVVHEITLGDDSIEDNELVLEGVDLNDTRAIADYYLTKNNIIDQDELDVEKKENELRNDIKEVIKDNETLVDYLTNLHASIEVMEERIYELELKSEQKERQSIVPPRPPSGGLSGGGLSQLPIGLF
jgi:predicted nuclease with TOPRIM domain